MKMINKKIFTGIVVGMILLVGILGYVSAANYTGVITNNTGIQVNDIFSGETANAHFNFTYSDYYGTTEFPHVLQINFTSNDTNYPVWKGDFILNGFVRKSTFFGLFHTDVPFECRESSPLTINNSYFGLNTVSNVPNGTFYCFNETRGAIQNLDKNDEVYFNISSNPMLWPGKYNISAGVFYLFDKKAPTITILNKSYFDQYFSDGSGVDFDANVSDFSGLSANPSATILSTIGQTNFSVNDLGSNIYEFLRTLPVNIPEGNWPLTVRATDTSGNTANENVTIKIDRTGPTIKVLTPDNNTIVSDLFNLTLNVTDLKSGVNESQVYYELAAVINGAVCPDTGTGYNATCPNTHWVNIPYNSSTGLYYSQINTTNFSSGSYWLYSKAYDKLGNLAELS